MKEIGGYIEFEHYHGEMLHGEAVALNCGRNCLAYLFKSRGIKKLRIQYFLCDCLWTFMLFFQYLYYYTFFVGFYYSFITRS